jgi:hypothetical protein
MRVAVFPNIFFEALPEFSCNSTEKFLLQRPEDISGMEECKILVYARGILFRLQQGAFSFLYTGIFQRRASFWVALVTVHILPLTPSWGILGPCTGNARWYVSAISECRKKKATSHKETFIAKWLPKYHLMSSLIWGSELRKSLWYELHLDEDGLKAFALSLLILFGWAKSGHYYDGLDLK